MMEIAKSVKETAQLARDVAKDCRSLLEQSSVSVRYNNRSAVGQVDQIRGTLNRVENRINSEEKVCQKFWESIRAEMDGVRLLFYYILG